MLPAEAKTRSGPKMARIRALTQVLFAYLRSFLGGVLVLAAFIPLQRGNLIGIPLWRAGFLSFF